MTTELSLDELTLRGQLHEKLNGHPYAKELACAPPSGGSASGIFPLAVSMDTVGPTVVPKIAR